MKQTLFVFLLCFSKLLWSQEDEFVYFFPFHTSTGWGYIDTTGKIRIPCVYDKPEHLKPIRCKSPIVVSKNKKYGVKNIEKEIPCIYDSVIIYIANRMYDAVIICQKDKKWGILDTKNKLLIPLEYEAIYTLDSSGFLSSNFPRNPELLYSPDCLDYARAIYSPLSNHSSFYSYLYFRKHNLYFRYNNDWKSPKHILYEGVENVTEDYGKKDTLWYKFEVNEKSLPVLELIGKNKPITHICHEKELKDLEAKNIRLYYSQNGESVLYEYEGKYHLLFYPKDSQEIKRVSYDKCLYTNNRSRNPEILVKNGLPLWSFEAQKPISPAFESYIRFKPENTHYSFIIVKSKGLYGIWDIENNKMVVEALWDSLYQTDFRSLTGYRNGSPSVFLINYRKEIIQHEGFKFAMATSSGDCLLSTGEKHLLCNRYYGSEPKGKVAMDNYLGIYYSEGRVFLEENGKLLLDSIMYYGPRSSYLAVLQTKKELYLYEKLPNSKLLKIPNINLEGDELINIYLSLEDYVLRTRKYFYILDGKTLEIKQIISKPFLHDNEYYRIIDNYRQANIKEKIIDESIVNRQGIKDTLLLVEDILGNKKILVNGLSDTLYFKNENINYLMGDANIHTYKRNKVGIVASSYHIPEIYDSLWHTNNNSNHIIGKRGLMYDLYEHGRLLEENADSISWIQNLVEEIICVKRNQNYKLYEIPNKSLSPLLLADIDAKKLGHSNYEIITFQNEEGKWGLHNFRNNKEVYAPVFDSVEAFQYMLLVEQNGRKGWLLPSENPKIYFFEE